MFFTCILWIKLGLAYIEYISRSESIILYTYISKTADTKRNPNGTQKSISASFQRLFNELRVLQAFDELPTL